MEHTHTTHKEQSSRLIKIALFATGFSGIVAEYVLATMATYFLGNSVLQFTMILSVMLFSMGLGSRFSKYFSEHLLEKFLLAELALSILVGFAAIIVYTVAGFSLYKGLAIYTLSILIGLLIGLEIPLVTRINSEYEQLKTNISSVMENDYYGSLVGGVFFAYIGLPYLGLTYTPFVLGGINFLVALFLFYQLKKLIVPRYKTWLNILAGIVGVALVGGVIFAEPIILYGEQARYKDKVIFEKQSRYQKVVVTQWKDEYWLYINGNQQFSTLDEWLYHEPMVHPVMNLGTSPRDILIVGGGDGAIVRELLKYPSVNTIRLVDLDPVITDLGQEHPIFVEMNQNSLKSPKVEITNDDAFTFIEQDKQFYDLIIVDLPDPKTVELSRLYSKEFYFMCHRQLRERGLFITQAGSPYYATQAFKCIEKTLQAAGFNTLPLHNQVVTLGEWGWQVGSKTLLGEEMKKRMVQMDFEGIETRWINKEAMSLITSFGKDFTIVKDEDVEVNTVHNPVLRGYYKKGNWDLY